MKMHDSSEVNCDIQFIFKEYAMYNMLNTKLILITIII